MRAALDMFSKTWFINSILALCVIFFGAKSIGVWSEENGGDARNIQRSAQVKASDIPRVVRGVLPPEDAYEVVAANDLFTSDRMERVEEDDEEKKENPEEPAVVEKDVRISGKKIVLYGVVVKDNTRTALISDPQPKPPKRPFLWVREGDTIGDTDVMVSAIKKESLVLKKGADLIEISLYDHEKNNAQVAGRKPRQPEDKPVIVTTQQATKVTVERTPRPKAERVVESEGSENSPVKGEEYEMVDTPFGKIKRKKK